MVFVINDEIHSFLSVFQLCFVCEYNIHQIEIFNHITMAHKIITFVTNLLDQCIFPGLIYLEIVFVTNFVNFRDSFGIENELKTKTLFIDFHILLVVSFDFYSSLP